jgi:quercetin dioxygenase-like cupin family protein
MRMAAAVMLVGAGFLAGVVATQAQAPGEIKRSVLLTKSLAPQGYNGIVGRGEVPVGMAAPAHFHHGDELVVLLEGEVEVEIQGAAPVRVKAGEAISVWVVEKDKPFAVNVP